MINLVGIIQNADARFYRNRQALICQAFSLKNEIFSLFSSIIHFPCKAKDCKPLFEIAANTRVQQ